MYSGFRGGATPGSGPNMYSYPCSHHTPSKLRGSGFGGAEPFGAGPAPRSGGVRARVGSPLSFSVLGAGAASATAPSPSATSEKRVLPHRLLSIRKLMNPCLGSVKKRTARGQSPLDAVSHPNQLAAVRLADESASNQPVIGFAGRGGVEFQIAPDVKRERDATEGQQTKSGC
jgi:hypothetical protein